MIELKSFLVDPTVASGRCVICLHAADPLVLCMRPLSTIFERLYALKTSIVSMQLSDEPILRARFNMCFLGQRQLLILSGFEQLTARMRERWAAYVRLYTGPHVLIVQVSRSSARLAASDNVVDIVVPDRIGTQDTAWLSLLWDAGERERVTKFLSVIIRDVGPIDIERVCALAQYARVVGSGLPEFVHDWAELIVQPERSLFDLSSRLFAGDMRRFLLQWSKLQDEYAPVFWPTYWSEQFFRAHWYIYAKKRGDTQAARTIGARLPFSFINRDWHLHDIQCLANAQARAFELDLHLKRGGTPQTLVSLFIPFFGGRATFHV